MKTVFAKAIRLVANIPVAKAYNKALPRDLVELGSPIQ